MECVTEPCCRSVNYRMTLMNEANCEMLHTLAYNKTGEDLLEINSSYDYIYITHPRKV